MKYIETAKLRESVLSKIKHQYDFIEIEKALDEYGASVEGNYQKEIDRLRQLVAELSVYKPAVFSREMP